MSDELKKELKEYASECCGKPCVEVPEQVVKTSPGVTSYYRYRCFGCGKLCDTVLHRLWDSDGVEVLEGLLETPDNGFWDWHAVYREGHELVIRDLNANNVQMWDFPAYYRGHYSEHRDKLSDDDVKYYWGTRGQ